MRNVRTNTCGRPGAGAPTTCELGQRQSYWSAAGSKAKPLTPIPAAMSENPVVKGPDSITFESIEDGSNETNRGEIVSRKFIVAGWRRV
jgi:hypothetical protein